MLCTIPSTQPALPHLHNTLTMAMQLSARASLVAARPAGRVATRTSRRAVYVRAEAPETPEAAAPVVESVPESAAPPTPTPAPAPAAPAAFNFGGEWCKCAWEWPWGVLCGAATRSVVARRRRFNTAAALLSARRALLLAPLALQPPTIHPLLPLHPSPQT